MKIVFFLILDPNNLFPMEEEEKVKMCQFLVVSLEQVWLLRNKRLQGATIPPLHILCQSINNLTGIYKKVVEGRHRLLTPLHKAEEWIPPPTDYTKMNFDASYLDNQATPGILVGNSIRVIIKAWISRFTTSSPFEAEAEVAHQALKLAQDLNFTNMIIEGDNRSLEWRGKHDIDNCRFCSQTTIFGLFILPIEIKTRLLMA